MMATKLPDAEWMTVKEVSDMIGCSPQRLRDALDIDDDLPIDRRRFLFPHCKVGDRRRISREGFDRWMRGDLNPVTAVFWMKNGGGAN